jgi:hypothetical protein
MFSNIMRLKEQTKGQKCNSRDTCSDFEAGAQHHQVSYTVVLFWNIMQNA